MTALAEFLRPPFEHAIWMDLAECRRLGPGLFYPARGEDPRPALQVCASCPVVAECLAYALAQGEHFGVWGGTTERDRRRLRGWRLNNTGRGLGDR